MKSTASILFTFLICVGPFASAAQVEAKPVQTALTATKDKACSTAYQRLYGKGSAQIRVAFGYKDTRPSRFVGDRHERIAFVQKILKPCEGQRQDCGFTRNPDHADLFTKTIQGPDQKPVKIELLVTHSSLTSDDSSNRLNPFQKWQSSYAQKAFTGGLERADVVLYNGHSRFGGGPDFEPPRLTAEGDVDASYYQNSRPGFQKIREKLRERSASDSKEEGLKILGLFSCASSQHFADGVIRDSDAGVVSSQALIYYADALDNSLAALSGLLEMRCERDLKTLIRQNSPIQGAQMQGFF